MKILVVDNNELHQKSAEITLSDHDVTILSSFEESIDLLKEEKFEAILVDMMMPQGTGWGVFQPGTEEVPYGFPLALIAVKSGAKYVGMVSDANHHSGAMPATIDYLENIIFHIEKAKVVYRFAPGLRLGKKDVPCEHCSGTGKHCNNLQSCRADAGNKYSSFANVEEFDNTGCCVCNGTGILNESIWGKDWGEVLAQLIAA